jgi:hypothetical protein
MLLRKGSKSTAHCTKRLVPDSAGSLLGCDSSEMIESGNPRVAAACNMSTGDEAVTDGSEGLSAAAGDTVSNSIATDTSSACNGLPSVGRVAISMLMAILLTAV